MRRSISIFILCVVAISVTAQRIVSVSGEYTYYAPSTMTLEEAKQEAILQTKLHVLAAKFGTLINSTTTLILENKEGSDAKSRADVSTLSTHEVKGEWIEDSKAPEQSFSYDKSMPNTTIIHTKVWGKAREVIAAKADINIQLLKAPYKEATSEVFKHKQKFYLYFQSPVAGHIAIYLLDTDEDMAYCLLPYANDSQGSYYVESNQEYIFFKEVPYMFTTNRSVIYNHIVVIFTPNELFKANDAQGQYEDYTRPRELSLKDFNQWMARCKARDTQLVEKRIAVQIIK